MGMTITEKILADHAGKKEVRPGELITARIDLAMANDVTAPLAIKIMEKYGVERVFDPQRIALVLSHFVPAKDIKSAEQAKLVREFARKHSTCTYGGIGAFSTGVGSTDIAYAMVTGEIWLRVPESMKFIFYGKAKPWVTGKDLILHTIGEIGVDGALYRAMEFDGEAIRELSIEQRLTVANMAVEAGGKSGIIPPDEKTVEYVRSRAKRDWKIYRSDADAEYHSIYEWDAGRIEPLVAWPYLPSKAEWKI